jgi:hypothetical protein
VSGFYSKNSDWNTLWGLDVEQHRDLLISASQVLEKEGQNSMALDALIQYIRTFASEQRYPASVESLISAAVVNAIKSPVGAFNDRSALLEVRVSVLFQF